MAVYVICGLRMMSHLSATMMLTSLCSFLHHFSQPDPSQEALYSHSIHTELITDREIFAARSGATPRPWICFRITPWLGLTRVEHSKLQYWVYCALLEKGNHVYIYQAGFLILLISELREACILQHVLEFRNGEVIWGSGHEKRELQHAPFEHLNAY